MTSTVEDLIRGLVRVQKRVIHRSAHYWIDAAERVQSGDLSPSTWFTAYARYLNGLCVDVTGGESPPARAKAKTSAGRGTAGGGAKKRNRTSR